MEKDSTQIKNTQIKIDTLKNEFEKFSNWEEKYNHIIKMGKSLEPLSEEFKNPELLVKGCQSQVWLKPDLNSDGKIDFKGESDSIIVQGLLALILSVYSGESPETILSTPPQFLEDLGLKKHLTPNRANGVYAMVKQILYYAQAFKLLKN